MFENNNRYAFYLGYSTFTKAGNTLVESKHAFSFVNSLLNGLKYVIDDCCQGRGFYYDKHNILLNFDINGDIENIDSDARVICITSTILANMDEILSKGYIPTAVMDKELLETTVSVIDMNEDVKNFIIRCFYEPSSFGVIRGYLPVPGQLINVLKSKSINEDIFSIFKSQKDIDDYITALNFMIVYGCANWTEYSYAMDSCPAILGFYGKKALEEQLNSLSLSDNDLVKYIKEMTYTNEFSVFINEGNYNFDFSINREKLQFHDKEIKRSKTMKKFNVSEKCICCGACVAATDLLVENDEGKAKASDKGYISDDFMQQAEEIVKSCPVNAISIINAGISSDTGEKGLIQLANLLEHKLKEIQISEISCKDVNFDAKNYPINCPYPNGQHKYIYSSSSKAVNAGFDEFKRIAYSQHGRFITDILVQYKIDKIRPYYIFDESSYYYQMNKQFEKVLNNFANEAEALSDGKISFSNNFVKFDVFPKKDGNMEFASEFEEFQIQSQIMHELHDFASLDSYKSSIDWDDMEVYAGTSLFGNEKYKDMYCYQDVYEVVEEFITDLKDAMNYMDDVIEEKAVSTINWCIKPYKEEVNKQIIEKVNEYKRIIDNFLKETN